MAPFAGRARPASDDRTSACVVFRPRPSGSGAPRPRVRCRATTCARRATNERGQLPSEAREIPLEQLELDPELPLPRTLLLHHFRIRLREEPRVLELHFHLSDSRAHFVHAEPEHLFQFRRVDLARQADEDLDRTRDERRKATVTRLRERWGSLVDSEAARQELKTHAERVARLARIRSLAEDKKKLSMIESVDGLVTKEELRHGTAMNALRASGGKP